MKLIANLSELDRKAVLQGSVTAADLMETAGLRVAQAVQNRLKPESRGVIICGPGKNGGDGFVCTQKLHQAGFHQLTVIYTGKNYKGESLAFFEQLMTQLPRPIINAREQPELCQLAIGQADFIVDALFGSGLSRQIIGPEASLIAAVQHGRDNTNKKSLWVISVDLPSGIDAATGQIWGCAVEADLTVTFAAAKPGLYLHPGKGHAGEVSIADIGLPTDLVEVETGSIQLITQDIAKSWLPVRKSDSHKMQYGHLLVIAGSQNMPGAAILCSEAAMSAGAGLVTLATPASVLDQMQLMPEVMRLALPDIHFLGKASITFLETALAQKAYQGILIGPGLGGDHETVDAVQRLLEKFKSMGLPVIVDADGLNALSKSTGLTLSENFILTPHIGEAARLLEEDSASISSDAIQAVSRICQKYQTQVVLKSAATVIASKIESAASSNSDMIESNLPCWISPTGNPGMATAGSGDVLAGIMSALATQRCAQDQSVWQAGPLGVYLHGLAGACAAETRTFHAMRASDITAHLPQAFRQLL